MKSKGFLFARGRDLRLEFQLGCFNCLESHAASMDGLSALKKYVMSEQTEQSTLICGVII